MTVPGLIYFPDSRPLSTRPKPGHGFSRRAPEGTLIDSATERRRLANTPTIARNSYIHPAVIALTDSDPADRLALIDSTPAIRGLRHDERVRLRLLATGR